MASLKAQAKKPVRSAPAMSEQESRAWEAATAALDRIAADMERLWGVGRLETLVEADLAAKFATAKAECDAAISTGDVQLSAQKAAAVGRGYGVLHQAALAKGHKPNDTGAVWCAEAGGRAYAACLHRADVGAVAARFKDHTAVSLQELLALLAATEAGRLVVAAKDQWPGATVAVKPKPDPKPPADWSRGDEIPF